MRLDLGGACLLLLAACATPGVELRVGGAALEFQDAQVLAVDDANEVYQVTLSSRHAAGGAQVVQPVLLLGRRQWSANQWGGSGETLESGFRVPADEARLLARALGVRAREREPWRGGLAGKLEPAGELRAGAEHLPLRFTLTNTGPVALWFMDGGRGRNELGRDNRFTVEVEGLRSREIPDFGGMGVCRRLEPGESHVFELDLAHWCRPERAGSCRVHVAYEAELMPAEFEPGATLQPGWHAYLERTRSVPAELALELR